MYNFNNKTEIKFCRRWCISQRKITTAFSLDNSYGWTCIWPISLPEPARVLVSRSHASRALAQTNMIAGSGNQISIWLEGTLKYYFIWCLKILNMSNHLNFSILNFPRAFILHFYQSFIYCVLIFPFRLWWKIIAATFGSFLFYSFVYMVSTEVNHMKPWLAVS